MATETIVIPGNGTGTLSVQLHGPDITDVEAVLAEIDTSGAGDTIATLTATSPTGNDVAAVPQGSPVSGGGQGRATWALRLAEDAGAAAPLTGMEVLSTPLVGITVPPHTVTKLAFGHHSGPVWLDNFPDNRDPTVIRKGTYAFSLVAELMAPQPFNTDLWWATLTVADTLPTVAAWPGSFGGSAFTGRIVGLPLVRECAAGAVLNVIVFHNQAVNCFMRGYGVVTKLA